MLFKPCPESSKIEFKPRLVASELRSKVCPVASEFRSKDCPVAQYLCLFKADLNVNPDDAEERNSCTHFYTMSRNRFLDYKRSSTFSNT